MDPLSISASIAGLIMITNSIVTNGFKYLSEFKESGETVKSLFHEVNLLFGTLHSLQNVAARLEHQQSSIPSTTRIHHINACYVTLRKVEAQLEKVAAKRNTATDRTRQRVLWPLSKVETENLLLEVERQKTSLSLALSADELSALLSALASQDIIQKGISKITEELHSHRTERDVNKLSKKRQNIIRSLNTVDYNQYQSSNVRLRQAGTGCWFLDGTEFKHWLSIADGKLWLYGIPGAGKTVLMATTIQEAQRLVSEPGSQLGMAFFFCDYKKPETHLASTILGSLVKQLALQDERSLLDLEEFYEVHNPKEHPPKEVTAIELCELLKKMASHFKNTMILIDGLDEIETNRIETLEMLCDLASTGNLKTIFASRDEVDIRNCLAQHTNISIAAQSGDLRLYVAAEIEIRTARHQFMIRDPELKEHIMKTLITGAEGMFRWVACQMDYLCELNNDDDRRKALHELPRGLPATYERILERIKLKQNQELVKRTLRWIVCSKEPVLSEVLLAVLSIKDGDKNLNRGAMTTMVDIMRWCSSLIRWKDQEMKYIELAHFTVKEFLLSINPEEQTSVADYRIEIPKDEYHLAKICLTILNFEEFAAKPPPRRRDTLSWVASAEIQEAFQYASGWWPIHAYNHLEEEQISSLIKKLFGPVKSNNFLWWIKYFAVRNQLALDKYPEMTTLHLAAHFGLSSVVKWLLGQEAVDVNSASQMGTPIFLAIYPYSSLPRCFDGKNTLLGANKAVTPCWNTNPCYETVKILLDGGAQVNSSSGLDPLRRKLRSPLDIALLFHSDTPILVNILLAHGARITNSVLEAGHQKLDKFYDDDSLEAFLALLRGVTDDNVDHDAREHLSQFRERVFAKGRDISDTSFYEGQERYGLLATRDMVSELKTAASNGQLDRVENCLAILQKSSQETDNSEAIQMSLHLAARYHHLSAVEFLLRSGASTKHQDEVGDTPLHQACKLEPADESNGLKIVDLLLRGGSDPTVSNKAGISPLHIAAGYQNTGSAAVLSLLAKATPDTKCFLEQGVSQPSPLWIAIEAGCDEVASFLLGMCNIDNLRGLVWKKLSCLVPAVQRDSCAILEMLLEKGFDVNSPVGDGSLAIHYASEPGGSPAAMKVLLSKDADFSSKRKDGSTALHIIAEQIIGEDFVRGSNTSTIIEKTKALLSAGADINSTNARGCSVLQVAVANDWHGDDDDALEIISLFTEREGVDINHKDNDGQTALITSLQHGFFLASDLLIAHGCDITIRDAENRTALHYACEQKPSERINPMIVKLVEAGLQLSEKDSKSESAFELALYSKDLAPNRLERVPDSVLSAREQRKAQKVSDDLWAPFSETGGVFDSEYDTDSETDTDLNMARREYDRKVYFDDSERKFWQWWNERIVKCISHMSSDQLNQRLSTGRYPAGFLVQYATRETIKLILEKGVDIDAVDTINPTIPLDIAATHGCDSEIAALLIAKTRRPVDEFTGSQRLNPLQLCCAQPNPNMALLRQLLAAKADPTLRSRDGATPLMLAAGYGSIDSLKLLLKHNVPIDTQRDGSSTTALHWAVARGASEHVLALLKAGARVDIKSETGGCKHMTALLTAAVWGMWDIAETLIKHGTPASALEISGGTSVVHEAATNGEERILRLILDLPERPDLNTKNYNCLTPLELAAAKGNAACFKLLLDNGASLDAGTELNGGIAHASTSPVSNDIRKLLLRRDICWNVPSLMNSNNADFEDVLPLHRAASCGNNTCIQFLEKNGLIKDIDVQAEYGMTALHFATWSDQQETVKLLLQLGADPEKVETRYKQTPLISAARFNALKVIRPLLDHGCKTTTKDTYGLTAFMNAIQQNHTEMSKILQRHEDRVNGSLGWPDIPATPASGVSFAGQLLPTQSTQRRPKENHDMIQQLRDEILEFRQLLVKPELAPAADQPNTTVVQTSTITMTEIEQRQKVMTTTTKDNEVPSILEYQSYVVAAIVGGLAALLVWVVILLNRVNRAMMDIEMYIPRGR